MVAGFAAAYMSTIATQLNWGASYIVNHFYRRFLKPEASDLQLVRVSQVVTVLIRLVSAVVTFYVKSISGAWRLLIVTGAGTGGVLLLRWYWWRWGRRLSCPCCCRRWRVWIRMIHGSSRI